MSGRADDFKLPGGRLTYGEVRSFFGDEFAEKAFGIMERMQSGEGAAFGELMDLYFDYEAKAEGKDVIVLTDPPLRYSAAPGSRECECGHLWREHRESVQRPEKSPEVGCVACSCPVFLFGRAGNR